MQDDKKSSGLKIEEQTIIDNQGIEYLGSLSARNCLNCYVGL
jgi:hypothetical protein